MHPPAGDRLPHIVGMRSIDRVALETSDRIIPGNWDGALLIGGGGASPGTPLVEAVTGYLIQGYPASRVQGRPGLRAVHPPHPRLYPKERCEHWTRRSRRSDMASHQRVTHDTGVDVFFAHPHSP